MLPSIDTRIQNLIKAMQQVILPAMDPANKLAQEQAQLLMGHLHLISLHWDKAWLFETVSLAALKVLAATLCEARGGTRTTAAAAALRQALDVAAAVRPLTATHSADVRNTLGAAIDTLIEALEVDADDASREVAAGAIVAHGERQMHRERVWFAAAGLDPQRAELESIEQMLAAAMDEYGLPAHRLVF